MSIKKVFRSAHALVRSVGKTLVGAHLLVQQVHAAPVENKMHFTTNYVEGSCSVTGKQTLKNTSGAPFNNLSSIIRIGTSSWTRSTSELKSGERWEIELNLPNACKDLAKGLHPVISDVRAGKYQASFLSEILKGPVSQEERALLATTPFVATSYVRIENDSSVEVSVNIKNLGAEPHDLALSYLGTCNPVTNESLHLGPHSKILWEKKVSREDVEALSPVLIAWEEKDLTSFLSLYPALPAPERANDDISASQVAAVLVLSLLFYLLLRTRALKAQ